jgi:hypothetical protein
MRLIIQQYQHILAPRAVLRHSLVTHQGFAGKWEFFFHRILLVIFPDPSALRLPFVGVGDRDEGGYPGLAYLIAFSPIMANRRMAEARVGRSGSSLR